MKGLVPSIAVTLSMQLSACSDSLDNDYARIEHALNEKVGSDNDYYIGYRGLDGRFVHVGVIYGQANDQQLCEEIVTLYNNWKDANAYFCKQAN